MPNRKKAGTGSVPRRRHLPLKRYRVEARCPEVGTVTLVVRARSKKNATFFTRQSYNVTHVRVTEILGLCKEVKE